MKKERKLMWVNPEFEKILKIRKEILGEKTLIGYTKKLADEMKPDENLLESIRKRQEKNWKGI